MLSGIMIRLRALVRRGAADAELDEELRYHLQREVERHIASGMSARDARHAARRAFGNVTAATEQARDAMRWRVVEELRQDVVYALRTFRRAPAFVFTVVATIGLGLGLLTTAFTVFEAYVLRPFAVRDPASLYEIRWHTRAGQSGSFSAADYRLLADRRDVFAESFAYAGIIARLKQQPFVGQLVTGNYFAMLGATPALGRLLQPEDAAVPGGAPVIVLSYDTWQASFGGEASVIGRTIVINGVALHVVGVARRGFGGLEGVPIQFWAPYTMLGPIEPGRDPFTARNAASRLGMIGRLRRGVSTEQASAALLTTLRIATADEPTPRRAGQVTLEARSTSIPLTPEVIEAFTPLAIAFGLVMLIACANVANVMLARGMARQREIGIRLSLGAARARLIRQLLTESILLSVPSALVGFVVSRIAISAGLSIATMLSPAEYRGYLRPLPLTADLRVAVFIMLVAVAAALLFGLVPALQATQPSVVHATRGDFDSHLRPSRLRGAVVVSQIAVSLLLLITAGILVQAAHEERQRDAGVRVHNVLSMQVLDRRRERASADLRAMPGIVRVASATSTPLDGIFPSVAGGASRAHAAQFKFNVVSPEYFAVYDVALHRGRLFSPDEARARAPVALVSDGAARELWPGQDPIGKRIGFARDETDLDRIARYDSAVVIGVVANTRPGWIGLPMEVPVVYYPQDVNAPGTTLLARTTADAVAMRDRIERGMMGDSGAVKEVHTYESSLALQLYPFDIAYWVASIVGGVALLLTFAGVYGVLTYIVAQRTREFGVRLALGANPTMLMGLVFRHVARLGAIGFGIGLVFALASSKVLGAFIAYAIDVFDWRGYAIGVAVVVGACLVAAYLPARRAALVDPVEALRADS
jgi:predicted permease